MMDGGQIGLVGLVMSVVSCTKVSKWVSLTSILIQCSLSILFDGGRFEGPGSYPVIGRFKNMDKSERI
jgi:hypothetical protein